MKQEKAKPNFNIDYIKSAKKEDFISSHTGVFEGIDDKELEAIWAGHQPKESKSKEVSEKK